MLDLLAHRPFRVPRGDLFVPEGAPLSAGLASLWMAGQTRDNSGKFFRNVARPGEFMTRILYGGTGDPNEQISNEMLPSDLFGQRVAPMGNDGLANYGSAYRDTDPPWMPYAAGGHAPVTIAVYGHGLVQFNRYLYTVSSQGGASGQPLIGFFTNGDGPSGRIWGSSQVDLACPITIGNGPWVSILTSRSATDHELVSRVFGRGDANYMGIATSSSNCGSAAAETTHEMIAGARASSSWGSAEEFGFGAAWCWARGMERSEMLAFILDPFQMVRPASLLSMLEVAQGATGDLAVTEGDDALSAKVTVHVIGALSAAEADDTLAATGTTPTVISLAVTEDDDTLEAAATQVGDGVIADLLVAEDADTLDALAVLAVSGALSVAEDEDVLAAFVAAGSNGPFEQRPLMHIN